MKCDELKALVFSISDLEYVDEPTPQPNFQNPHDHAVYKATEVDKVLAQKDKEIAKLKEEVNNLLMQNRELCQALQVMYSAEEYAKLQAENAGLKAANKLLKEHIANGDVSRITWIDEVIELKAKLENVQASMYADVVDANMENRRLKRALWIARALRAKECKYKYETWERHEERKVYKDYDMIAIVSRKARMWRKVECKCLKKAEEYK